MKLYIAITDGDWYRFLREQPELDEINFWQPSSGRAFRALEPGEPFLFKLHSPHNYIVGGGFFLRYIARLPSSLAWEAFEEKNGAASFERMRRRIEKYRRVEPNRFDDYRIGCILLTQPFFFPETEWLEIPEDFSLNIQQGKTYDTATRIGLQLWEQVSDRLRAAQPMIADSEAALFGDPVPIRPRLGQGSFRVLVTDVYQRRCAITGEKALPALDAAHIRPVTQGGGHQVDNGLLFRTDVHRLFDRGYVTVTPDHRFLVSPRLKKDFDDGEPYYPLQDRQIWLPTADDSRPRKEFLEWHADEVFLR